MMNGRAITPPRSGFVPVRMAAGAAQAAQGAPWVQYQISGLHFEYVWGRRVLANIDDTTGDLIGETIEPEQVKIARPWILRVREDAWVHDGTTYTRIGTSPTLTNVNIRHAVRGSATQDHLLVPRYVTGDRIWVVRAVNALLEFVAATQRYDVVTDLLDVNNDGREWAVDDG